MERPGYRVHAVHVCTDIHATHEAPAWCVYFVDDEGGPVSGADLYPTRDDAWDAGCAYADEWMMECVEIDEHGTPLRRYRSEVTES